MSSLPVYAHLLKRVPEQSRSIRRVEAILGAADDLLGGREPSEVSIHDLAQEAAVPTGTIYQFFDDKHAVFQALALRYLSVLPAVLEEGPAAASDWATAVDRTVEGYASLFREHPAIRTLWLSGVLDAATRRVERETDITIAARLGDLLTSLAPESTSTGSETQWQALVALIDGVLRQAFTDDPRGDAATILEACRAARAYAAVVLAI